MGKLFVTPTIAIGEEELEETFIQSAGPGGQNVNKVASAVQLRFDAARSPSLSEPVRARLIRMAGRKLTKDGILVLTARRHRTQERNREDARARLVEMIRSAADLPTPRTPTKLPRAAKRRRSENKKRHASLKQLRSKPRHD